MLWGPLEGGIPGHRPLHWAVSDLRLIASFQASFCSQSVGWPAEVGGGGVGGDFCHLNPSSSTKLKAYKFRTGKNLTSPSQNSSFIQRYKRWVRQANREKGQKGRRYSHTSRHAMDSSAVCTCRQARLSLTGSLALKFYCKGGIDLLPLAKWPKAAFRDAILGSHYLK